MASTIQVRVDDDLKARSDDLFRRLGTDTTSAVRMFLTQSVLQNGFPFEIRLKDAETTPYAPMSEDELLSKLEKSRQSAAKGEVIDADEAVQELRRKYGL